MSCTTVSLIVSANLRFTLDTNVLVYSIDSAAGMRHRSAGEILAGAVRADCWLMLQAISEFFVVVRRKGMASAPQAAALAETWLTVFPCAAVSPGAVRTALADAVGGRASYWDALLIATAAEAGCTLILTEDLADGSALGGVEIHNPFDPAGGLTERARQLLGL